MVATQRLTWHPGVDMVTGWSNDGMKVVFTSGRKNAPYPDLDQLWEISTEGGNPSPLIYLELQTANSPQTDCSLYMNRFSLGA
jgi:Tol biopolymer transport system component